MDFCGLPSIFQYTKIMKWFENILGRPGFEAARNVSRPHFHITLNNLPEEELNNIAEQGKKWQSECPREKESLLCRDMRE